MLSASIQNPKLNYMQITELPDQPYHADELQFLSLCEGDIFRLPSSFVVLRQGNPRSCSCTTYSVFKKTQPLL